MAYTLASGEKFLAVAQSEYQNELNRTTIIDNKLSIALPIVSAYFFLVIQHSNIRKLFSAEVDTSTVGAMLSNLILPISFVLAIILSAVALVLMVCVVGTHSYEHIDTKQFNTAEQISLEPNQFSAALSTVYIRATYTNRKQNDIRVKEYKWGWICTAFSLGCFLIHVLFSV